MPDTMQVRSHGFDMSPSHTPSYVSARPQRLILTDTGHLRDLREKTEVKQPSLFERSVNWIKDHKKQILVALLIIGSAAFTMGAGLVISAASSSSLIGLKAFIIQWGSRWWMYDIIYKPVFTAAAKVVLSGIIAMGIGGMIASFSAGALAFGNNNTKK